MKKIFASLVAVAMGSALWAASPWWNAEWSGRVPVTVSTGMSPTPNAIVSVKMDGIEADATSFRVVDAENKPVPCAVRKDGSGKFFVAWRIAEPQMLDELIYTIYFDKNAKPAEAEAAGFPQKLPGMNLLSNGDLVKKTGAGAVAGWAVTTNGRGTPDKWTPETIAKVQIVEKDGRRALAIDGVSIVAPVMGLQEGHTYRLSYEGLNTEPQLTTITAWFRGQTVQHWLYDYANYKLASGFSSPGTWTKCSISEFGYTDVKTKKVLGGQQKLLPGTQSAFIEIAPRSGKMVYIANLLFEDITEKPLEAKLGAAEARQ